MAKALTKAEFAKIASIDKRLRKVVELQGVEYEFFMSPLTIKQNQQAQALANSDDANDLAIHLLINKAELESGQKIWDLGDFEDMKAALSKAEVDAVLLKLLTSNPDEVITADKSSSDACSIQAR